MMKTRKPGLLAGIEPEVLKPEHLKDVAQLHFKELSWSFNGQFGEEHIYELYQALSESKHFFGYVYYSKNQLIGFVTATDDFVDTRKSIIQVYNRKLLRVIMILLKNPNFLLAVLESKFIVPIVFRRSGGRAEWLTFITDTSKMYLSPLVAFRLIDVLREDFRNKGISHYMAQGFKNNPKAMKLYDKLGWRVVAKLPMHNIYYYPTSYQESDS